MDFLRRFRAWTKSRGTSQGDGNFRVLCEGCPEDVVSSLADLECDVEDGGEFNSIAKMITVCVLKRKRKPTNTLDPSTKAHGISERIVGLLLDWLNNSEGNLSPPSDGFRGSAQGATTITRNDTPDVNTQDDTPDVNTSDVNTQGATTITQDDTPDVNTQDDTPDVNTQDDTPDVNTQGATTITQDDTQDDDDDREPAQASPLREPENVVPEINSWDNTTPVTSGVMDVNKMTFSLDAHFATTNEFAIRRDGGVERSSSSKSGVGGLEVIAQYPLKKEEFAATIQKVRVLKTAVDSLDISLSRKMSESYEEMTNIGDFLRTHDFDVLDLEKIPLQDRHDLIHNLAIRVGRKSSVTFLRGHTTKINGGKYDGCYVAPCASREMCRSLETAKVVPKEFIDEVSPHTHPDDSRKIYQKISKGFAVASKKPFRRAPDGTVLVNKAGTKVFEVLAGGFVCPACQKFITDRDGKTLYIDDDLPDEITYIQRQMTVEESVACDAIQDCQHGNNTPSMTVMAPVYVDHIPESTAPMPIRDFGRVWSRVPHKKGGNSKTWADELSFVSSNVSNVLHKQTRRPPPVVAAVGPQKSKTHHNEDDHHHHQQQQQQNPSFETNKRQKTS
jgi:hypothetical protein